jgi:predicted lactoylglutathione lyase
MAVANPRKLFVNIRVADLKRSVDFFTALGFEFNPQFTNDESTCMIVSDDGYFMIHVDKRFKEFTKKAVCDTSTHAEALYAFDAASREEVDALADKALAAGGKPSNDPQDHGFMYLRSFQDPDGHEFEVFWMDPAALEQK